MASRQDEGWRDKSGGQRWGGGEWVLTKEMQVSYRRLWPVGRMNGGGIKAVASVGGRGVRVGVD